MIDSYPPLPGAGTVPPPAGAKPPAAAAAKPSAPKSAAPAAAAPPARVLQGSIAGLAGAAFADRERAPAARPAAPSPEPSHAPSARPPGAVGPASGLQALRGATRRQPGLEPRAAATGAPVNRGTLGGLPRWDNLRERLRLNQNLDADDPLYEQINAQEESELAILEQLRRVREETSRLLDRDAETDDQEGSARAYAEQAVKLVGDLGVTFDQRILPLLEHVSARLDDLERLLVNSPAVAPTPLAAAPPAQTAGWWRRLGRFLRLDD